MRTIPTGFDCTVYVNDPAVTTSAFHQVASLVMLNGQAVSRVDVFENGMEIGRFLATVDGRIY